MDPTKLLEADHRQVEALFEQIPQTEPDQRQALIDELSTSLQAHMELEESTLYPAMGTVTGGETVEEANTEHRSARKVLNDLLGLAPDKPGWEGALESLKAAISHHVEEEEQEIFPKLRNQGSAVLDEVSNSFFTKRTELGLPTDAETIATATTKEELLDEAQSIGVENASTMDKAQLAEAVAGAIGR